MVADNLNELHEFAKSIGLKRTYYHGVRKKHPHYDLLGKWKKLAINAGAVVVSSKVILVKSKELK